jgi:hypothetical protein
LSGRCCTYVYERPLSGSRTGQFINEDPALVGLNPSSGLTGDANTPTVDAFLTSNGQASSAYLNDPQELNLYSYGRDNPLKYTDPSGRQFVVPAVLAAIAVYNYAQSAIDAYTLYVTNVEYPAEFTTAEKMEAATNAGIDVTTTGLSAGLRAYAQFAGLGTSLDLIGAGSSIFGTLQNLLSNTSIRKKDLSPQGSLPTTPNATYSSAGGNPASFRTSNDYHASSYTSQTSFSSSNVQTRYQAVQRYNVAGGNTSPQNQLYVTPNGAVITWSGTVVSSAPSTNH